MAVIRPADNKTPCHKSPQKAMALRLIFAHSVRARAVCCSEGGLSLHFFFSLLPPHTRFVVGSKRLQLINESNSFKISPGLADAEQTLTRLFPRGSRACTLNRDHPLGGRGESRGGGAGVRRLRLSNVAFCIIKQEEIKSGA